MDDAFAPGLVLGLIIGVLATLLIQAYGRRKVKKALAAIRKEELSTLRDERDGRARNEPTDIARRLAVLEQIVTDNPSALAEQIEGLRREAL